MVPGAVGAIVGLLVGRSRSMKSSIMTRTTMRG